MSRIIGRPRPRALLTVAHRGAKLISERAAVVSVSVVGWRQWFRLLWLYIRRSEGQILERRECVCSRALASADTVLKPVKVAAAPVADCNYHLSHVFAHKTKII